MPDELAAAPGQPAATTTGKGTRPDKPGDAGGTHLRVLPHPPVRLQPRTLCTPCQRALFDQQNPADPDARDDPATWVWDTAPMRDALARLDLPATLVIYRQAARLTRRQLGERTGLSKSVIWYWESGQRQGIYDIRQLPQLTDALQAPRPALLPVILGHPQPPADPVPGPAAHPAGGTDYG
jgi:hypothetical protein